MKLHIGVDAETGLAHSAVVTSANVHDKHPLPELLHGKEELLYGDCAYASQQELIASKAPNACDVTNQRVRKGSVTEELERMVNRAKSKVRARVEHVFCSRQAAVRIQHGSLSRPCQERHARLCDARVGKHLPRARASRGMSASAPRTLRASGAE